MQVRKCIVKGYFISTCPYCRSIETKDDWTIATFRICEKDQTYKCLKCKKFGDIDTFLKDNNGNQ